MCSVPGCHHSADGYVAPPLCERHQWIGRAVGLLRETWTGQRRIVDRQSVSRLITGHIDPAPSWAEIEYFERHFEEAHNA